MRLKLSTASESSVSGLGNAQLTVSGARDRSPGRLPHEQSVPTSSEEVGASNGGLHYHQYHSDVDEHGHAVPNACSFRQGWHQCADSGMLAAVGPARSALSAALPTVVRALPPHELLACACTEYGAGVGGVRHSRGGHRAGADRRHCRRAWWPCLRPRSDPMPAICVTARMVPSSTGQSLCACRDVEYPE